MIDAIVCALTFSVVLFTLAAFSLVHAVVSPSRSPDTEYAQIPTVMPTQLHTEESTRKFSTPEKTIEPMQGWGLRFAAGEQLFAVRRCT